jgi:hypothetical protein
MRSGFNGSMSNVLSGLYDTAFMVCMGLMDPLFPLLWSVWMLGVLSDTALWLRVLGVLGAVRCSAVLSWFRCSLCFDEVSGLMLV